MSSHWESFQQLPSGALHTHLLTYPPSSILYSRVRLGTVRGPGALNPSRLLAELPSVKGCSYAYTSPQSRAALQLPATQATGIIYIFLAAT